MSLKNGTYGVLKASARPGGVTTVTPSLINDLVTVGGEYGVGGDIVHKSTSL